MQPPQGRESVDPQRVDLHRLADARCHADPIDPGIHPGQGVTGLSLGQQPVGRVDADAIPGALHVRRHHPVQHRDQRGGEVEVPGRRDMTVDGVGEPQRGVGGVVFGCAGVGGVGQHSLGDGRGVRPQQRLAFGGPAGGEEQPLIRGHGVA